jgi:hypothetical protein
MCEIIILIRDQTMDKGDQVALSLSQMSIMLTKYQFIHIHSMFLFKPNNYLDITQQACCFFMMIPRVPSA